MVAILRFYAILGCCHSCYYVHTPSLEIAASTTNKQAANLAEISAKPISG